MSKRAIWALAIVGALLVILWGSSYLPPQEICEAANSNQKDCTAYSVPLFLLVEVGKFLDGHEGAITALAGVAVAFFTATLWRSTDKLWAAGERQLAHSKESNEAQADKMERSIAEAANAAKAMSDANEIARENMERRLRAYLDFDGVHWIRDESKDTDDGVSAGVSCCVKNYGQTPASEVAFEFSYSAIGVDGEQTPMSDDPRIIPMGSIAPTDHSTYDATFIIPREIWAAFGDKCAHISHFIVRYKDAFRASHTLKSDFRSHGTSTEKWHTVVEGTREAD